MRSMGRQGRHAVGCTRSGARRTDRSCETRIDTRSPFSFLLASTKADRIGVFDGKRGHGTRSWPRFAGFRGIVADRDGQRRHRNGRGCHRKAALPVELVDDGKSAEQELSGASDQLVFGVLVELRRAAWCRFKSPGRLCGVLFAGIRRNTARFRSNAGVVLDGTGAAVNWKRNAAIRTVG